jgi:hypothetical protein
MTGRRTGRGRQPEVGFVDVLSKGRTVEAEVV